MDFTKYQGLGNDFILVDNRHAPDPIITPQQAQHLCDRHFGIGGDGVIFLLPGTSTDTATGRYSADYTMRIYNSDSSEPEMCGNGIRCLARFIADLEGQPAGATPTYKIHTLAGLMVPQIQADGQITVDMGPPRLLAAEIPTTLAAAESKVIDQPLHVASQDWSVTCVSMGNPHCITFVDDVSAIDLPGIGPQFEHHPAFPQRINTEFIQIVRPDYLKMRVWERGAGITLACGTGACASLVAGVISGRCEAAATVELPGGCLEIRWDGLGQSVLMTGPAVAVFSGSVDLA